MLGTTAEPFTRRIDKHYVNQLPNVDEIIADLEFMDVEENLMEIDEVEPDLFAQAMEEAELTEFDLDL